MTADARGLEYPKLTDFRPPHPAISWNAQLAPTSAEQHLRSLRVSSNSGRGRKNDGRVRTNSAGACGSRMNGRTTLRRPGSLSERTTQAGFKLLIVPKTGRSKQLHVVTQIVALRNDNWCFGDRGGNYSRAPGHGLVHLALRLHGVVRRQTF